MPLVPDHVGALRQTAPPLARNGRSALVVAQHGDADVPSFDKKGNLIRIDHPDGSITISTDGSPLSEPKDKDTSWFANLAEDIPDDELSRISEDLLRGIADDIASREEWIQERAQGIKLLGLKIEVPGLQGAADGAPVEGMSKVRHPLLQEAVLRFQANARSELLPTDGPVKIRNDNNDANLNEDQVANALEMDMNHYLTSVAHEYYPDTDRMFLLLGFGGTTFKKIYFSPLKNRPVSETVDADDLIVNNAATDLHNAKRITHRSFMRPSVVKRLQILGVYRDIDLSTPLPAKLDTVQLEKNAQQGKQQGSFNRPEDRDFEIYECYCELDIRGYEHKFKGRETGLEIPYRVTIDVSSKQILSIVRNYDKEDKELPEPRIPFAKYTFVPGFGFYDIGLLHILGNTTNALTAVWRELLDAGMYACFPGFLISKQGARQTTNILRIPPGGAAQIDTGGLPIAQVAMPLPYKEPSSGLIALGEEMAQTGQRVGGTAEAAVGEGRQDAPVGTTLALIEQGTKLLNSVHKRMHSAQCEEFRLLFECFREHPESFWEMNKKPSYKWDEETFKRALDDVDLVPQSDPNTASSIQRLMKVQALITLAQVNPTLYDPIAINRMAIQALGFSNPDQFMAPASAMAQPPPEIVAEQQKAQSENMKAQAALIIAQGRAKLDNAKAAAEGHGEPGQAGPTSVDMVNAQAKLMDAHTKAKLAQMKHGEILLNDANQQEDRQTDVKLQTMNLAKEVLIHDSDQKQDMARHQIDTHANMAQHREQMQTNMAQHQDQMQNDMAKHESQMGADMHKHESGLKADMAKHKTDSKIAEQAAKQKAKAAAKPKPKTKP